MTQTQYNMDQIMEKIRSGRQDAPCVSIYLNKPHARLSEDITSIELYRQLSYARSLLETSSSRQKAGEYLKPLLLVAHDELLKEEEGTLALFHSGDFSACIRLPERVPQRTVVAEDFHIKPFAKKDELRDGVQLQLKVQECAEALAGGKAVTGLYEVAQALKAGKVKQLWVAEDVTLWGLLNRRHGTMVLHPRQLNDRDADILDDLCEWGVDEGAEVIVLPVHQIPGQRSLIALLKDQPAYTERKIHV